MLHLICYGGLWRLFSSEILLGHIRGPMTQVIPEEFDAEYIWLPDGVRVDAGHIAGHIKRRRLVGDCHVCVWFRGFYPGGIDFPAMGLRGHMILVIETAYFDWTDQDLPAFSQSA